MAIKIGGNAYNVNISTEQKIERIADDFYEARYKALFMGLGR